MPTEGQHLWQPGQSGNPAGRTVGSLNKGTAELKALAREYGPEAVKKLARLMRGKDTALTRLANELAGKLAQAPTKEMAGLMAQLLAKLNERKPDNELGAAKELLDRGYGKAAQPLVGEDGTGPAKILIERHIIDPRVIEGEVLEQPNGAELPIIHVMRHPTVEEATDGPQPTGAAPDKADDS